MKSVNTAKIVFAHPAPSAWNIRNANIGNAALRTYLLSIIAAEADAPYSGPYASSMKRFAPAYTSKELSIVRPWKRMGMIQCARYWAVQPAMSRLAGRGRLPAMAGRRRCSGGICSSALWVCFHWRRRRW